MAAILTKSVRFLKAEETYTWIEARYGSHRRRLARMVSFASDARESPNSLLRTCSRYARRPVAFLRDSWELPNSAL